MTNSDRNAQSKFRRDALNAMASHSESVSLRLDRTEQTVSRLADNVSELSVSIKNQSANIDRLERAITRMVEGQEAQRETINNLIKLATALVGKVAS